MATDILKYYKPNVVIGVIAFSAIAIFASMRYWNYSVSILGIIGILLWLIDSYLWKWKPFIWMFKIKDFSGEYIGDMDFEFKDEDSNEVKGKMQHKKIISQTGSMINIISTTYKVSNQKSSESISKGLYVEQINNENRYKIIYTYLNEGNNREKFAPHYGTEVLEIDLTNTVHITGHYYTDRQPYQTRGTFSLKKVK